MFKVKYKNSTLAESDKVIEIEGNYYFPPFSLKNNKNYFDSDKIYICPWKGRSNYYDYKSEDFILNDVAWYYPVPKDGSIDIVGEDFSNYVAFDKNQVEITS